MTYILIRKAIDAFLNDIRMKVMELPEIRLDHTPAISGREEYSITMRYENVVTKRILTPHDLTGMKESYVIYMLNDMLEELNNPTKTIGQSSNSPSFPLFKLKPYDPRVFFGEKRLDDNIKRVIFSDPCTIVLWNDGTKTIVRCTDEKFDKEKGLAMCIAKKSLGNKGKYYDVFKKWIEEEEK